MRVFGAVDGLRRPVVPPFALLRAWAPWIFRLVYSESFGKFSLITG
jgi:hypothetical protein